MVQDGTDTEGYSRPRIGLSGCCTPDRDAPSTPRFVARGGQVRPQAWFVDIYPTHRRPRSKLSEVIAMSGEHANWPTSMCRMIPEHRRRPSTQHMSWRTPDVTLGPGGGLPRVRGLRPPQRSQPVRPLRGLRRRCGAQVELLEYSKEPLEVPAGHRPHDLRAHHLFTLGGREDVGQNFPGSEK